MNPPVATCPKCSDEMELGYTPDYAHNTTLLGQWIRGNPKRSWFAIFGYPVIRPTTSGKAVPMGVYRCKSCGFLEFYARDEFAPK